MPTILTEDQARARLNSDRNLVSRFGRETVIPTSNVEIIPIERPGRNEGSPNFTPEEKIDIATRTAIGESLSSVARDKDTTASVVRNIHNGHTKVDREAVKKNVENVTDIALVKLMASLGYITEDKLAKMNAKDLGNFAASMSKVVNNTIIQKDEGSQVHVHLYAPELRSERSFKTIEVRGV